MKQIGCLLYRDMTALDVVGTHAVLSPLPGADVRFVAFTPGPMLDPGEVLATA